jgi:hypothetical protein
MLKYYDIVDLYSLADNFFLFFDDRKAEEKAEEIRAKNKIAKIIKTKGHYTVFEIKKII